MTLYDQKFLQINQYSRPGSKLVAVRGIVIHWTADPGATDENEVNYFDGSDGGGGRYASAHFFVDKDSAIQDIPLNEVAYHANEKPCKITKLQATANSYVGGANLTAIGIEMCVEPDGTIHPATVERAAQIAAELCKTYNLNPLTDIYRHFDVTGKNCPAPWVTSPANFDTFKSRVKAILQPVTTSNAVLPIGVVTVTAQPSLNVRSGPGTSYPTVQPPLVTGTSWKAYDLKNGWYNVGPGWVSGEYVTFRK